MSTFPTGSAVARALKRDAGILTVAKNRAGYRVRDGMKGVSAPAIYVAISDMPDSRGDVLRAEHLWELLTELGWEVRLSEGSSVVYVDRVGAKKPSEGLEHVHAKYGYLREQKRQIEAEERARADLAE